MSDKDFNKNMQKMFFRLQKNIVSVRQNYLDNWGGGEITSLLFVLQEICGLMHEDYDEASGGTDD